MQTVAGVFARRADAARAAAGLEALGIARDRITVVEPGSDARRVPTDEGEQPGMGATVGAVVGAATGAAVGLPVGAAVTLLVPGVGPVIASGLIGAVLLGVSGATVGATLEESLVTGLPRDELFVYEDALRRGHSVVVALLEDDHLADGARHALATTGAETIDTARERSWLGLRPWEREHYAAGRVAFERDEVRSGAASRRHSAPPPAAATGPTPCRHCVLATVPTSTRRPSATAGSGARSTSIGWATGADRRPPEDFGCPTWSRRALAEQCYGRGKRTQESARCRRARRVPVIPTTCTMRSMRSPERCGC